MKKMIIKAEDRAFIKAFVKWSVKKGIWPTEYECSSLIQNMNGNHRDLVEDYLIELKLFNKE